MTRKFTKSASIKRTGSSHFYFPLNTLHAYEVSEIPVECVAGELDEWQRLLADVLAAHDASFGSKLAEIRTDEWNSIRRLGYEVEEIDLE